MAARNDTSAAKKQSDYFLSYARMVAIKADLVEMIRLGHISLNAEQLALIDDTIADLRTHIKFD